MRSLFSVLALTTVLFFAACGDSHNVEIHFHNPTNGAVVPVANASALTIDIDFSSDEELHDIEIKLYPSAAPDDLIIDYDGHVHESEYVFEQDVDLSSFDSGTSFAIQVTVCENHDCTVSKIQEILFTIE
ncbi:MAG: hypothetical protein ACPGLV_06500 [Bacteroidia bacterium]